MENSHRPPSSFPSLFPYIPPSSSPFISVSSSLFLTPAAPACLTLCTRSLFLGNCSPLARALLWSRPPSSCFLNPPAEWVSDWPRGRREEREEEVTLFSLYVCMNGGVVLHKPPITVTSACLLSTLIIKTAAEPLMYSRNTGQAFFYFFIIYLQSQFFWYVCHILYIL